MIKKITFLLIGLITAINVFASSKTLMMATTTSTDNTGLLDYLAKKFLQDTSIQLRWVSVGSGKALVLGENCDVDILLVHSPKAEEQFMQKGYGDTRTKVMYNDFILVGPKDDPIKTQGLPIDKSFETIFKTKTLFISRNDESGTDKKEKALWQRINVTIPEQAKWYIRSGQGMMAILNMAAQMSAYTLTDRATFIKFDSMHKDSPLKILSQIEPVLRNQYSVIPISAKHCKNTKIDFATTFKNWLISEQVQKFISQFKLLNQTLYTPNATES